VDSINRWFIFEGMTGHIHIIIAAFFVTLGFQRSMALAQPDSVLIYMHGGGVHSDIIVPVANAYWNWHDHIQRPHHGEETQAWLAFGWGSKPFYVNTPKWSEVKLKHILGAMIGVGGAAYHIHTTAEPQLTDKCKAIRIHMSEYRALCSFLLEQFTDTEKPIPYIAHKPAKEWDAFYGAKGHYWLLNNCNTWTNRALMVCGRSQRKWVLTYGQVLKSIK
jgi:uncharacterized protein (TIGR02117 family)